MLKKISVVVLALLRLVRGAANKLVRHTKEVERRRHCACCGGMTSYFVTTAFKNTRHDELALPLKEILTGRVNEGTPTSLLLADTPEFFLCNDHHPFIGKFRDETRKLLTHPKLEFHLILPNPFK